MKGAESSRLREGDMARVRYTLPLPPCTQACATSCHGGVHRSGPDQQTSPPIRIREALSHLEEARVVAVLRGGHPERLYRRGMELSRMAGCRAIEVALDTPGALEALGSLAQDLPSSVIVGAATAMSARQARQAVRAGARFVTSPTNPKGLIEAAHAGGALAIPGGMTPTELLAIGQAPQAICRIASCFDIRREGVSTRCSAAQSPNFAPAKMCGWPARLSVVHIYVTFLMRSCFPQSPGEPSRPRCFQRGPTLPQP